MTNAEKKTRDYIATLEGELYLIGYSDGGRYAALWNATKDEVKIIALEGEKPIGVTEWTEEPSIGEITDILEAEHSCNAMTGSEMVWMLQTSMTVEGHQEYAASDIKRHGEIGVTY